MTFNALPGSDTRINKALYVSLNFLGRDSKVRWGDFTLNIHIRNFREWPIHECIIVFSFVYHKQALLRLDALNENCTRQTKCCLAWIKLVSILKRFWRLLAFKISWLNNVLYLRVSWKATKNIDSIFSAIFSLREIQRPSQCQQHQTLQASQD